jgi:hypothetical protein
MAKVWEGSCLALGRRGPESYRHCRRLSMFMHLLSFALMWGIIIVLQEALMCYTPIVDGKFFISYTL